ncbi:MAG: hypothetical protein M3198_14915 [Actinomycetota bacterium]|nr:hypothetical protein [Actinomycetota bacterium]
MDGLVEDKFPLAQVPLWQFADTTQFVLQTTARTESPGSTQPILKATAEPAVTGSGESMADVMVGAPSTRNVPEIEPEHALAASQAKA